MASHTTPLYVCLFFFSISYLPSTLTESDNYIVHMDLSAMPKAFSSHHNWYMATLASVLETSQLSSSTNTYTSFSPSSSKLIYSYSHVINGFTASLSPSEHDALKSSPGYVSSIRDLPVKADTTHSAQFLGLNDNSGAWPNSNFGQDIIIGLVDTGIWPESKSFNDNGMSEVPSRWKGECDGGNQFNSSLCNKKLVGARFFNKGLIAKDPNATKTISNSTRDIDGHGTHTSSTAAGNFVEDASYFGYAPGTAIGIAPKARVAMYKALWDEGGMTSDIIAAIEQAILDGVDVISISLGLDGVPLYEDPIAIATFSALEKGIFVSTSAGNEGPFIGTLHNGTPWVLTVAAGNMDRDFGGVITLGNGDSVPGPSLFPGNSSASKIPIVFMDACDNLKTLIKIGNKIVVCQDKNGSVSDQVDNLTQAKVAAGVFITNMTDLEFLIQSTFPSIFLNPKSGETVERYIKTNSQPKASLEFRKTILGTKPTPTVTSYSSRGPSRSCPFVLKPDLMAPGALVLAAWPPKSPAATLLDSQVLFSNFNLLSGTSMSCPHAAGVAALLKAAHPEWSPAAIRSAMMTTSDTVDNTQGPIKDVGNDNKPASPFAIGAGHVNPNKAIDPGLIYDVKLEDYVNLLCALNYSMKQIQTITKSASYNCSTSSLDLNYPSFIAFFNANDSNSDLKTVQEFHRTVTNIGGQSTYISSVTPMKGIQVRVTPDKLVFKEKNENQSFKLSIEGPRRLQEGTVFGYLSWSDTAGKHVVRSPIVATGISSNILPQS
ncbi:subtilisin-like protease SBT3 [Alnus glutinosa]|uniref:subtilisin-like protease SBT3 n=1 Tax=Alnus glutinosa TaxID=3517 RepID=UPI002D77D2E7|nr:subtilisin-like protease SBT3 [Alnus glutinosa]